MEQKKGIEKLHEEPDRDNVPHLTSPHPLLSHTTLVAFQSSTGCSMLLLREFWTYMPANRSACSWRLSLPLSHPVAFAEVNVDVCIEPSKQYLVCKRCSIEQTSVAQRLRDTHATCEILLAARSCRS